MTNNGGRGANPSAGSVRPDAWAVLHASGWGGVVDCYATKEFCIHHFPNLGREVFRYAPLYLRPQPDLTPDERMAISEAIEGYRENDDDPECNRIAWTLSGLLQRLK